MMEFAKLVVAGTAAFLIGRYLIRSYDRNVHFSIGPQSDPIGQSTGGDGVA